MSGRLSKGQKGCETSEAGCQSHQKESPVVQKGLRNIKQGLILVRVFLKQAGRVSNMLESCFPRSQYLIVIRKSFKYISKDLRTRKSLRYFGNGLKQLSKSFKQVRKVFKYIRKSLRKIGKGLKLVRRGLRFLR